MYSFRKITLCALCSLMIAGCSTMEDEGPRETIYTYEDPSINMTYHEMAREMSNGSVQIYGLDDPITEPLIMPEGVRTAGFDGGVSSSVDSSVTVYPLDDSSLSFEPTAQRPALRAPSSAQHPLHSPFGGPLEPQVPVTIDSGSDDLSFVPPPRQPFASAAPAGASRIYFGHGATSLNGSGKQVADMVAGKSTGYVVVEGHASERAETTDPVERQIVNLKVSMDRAFKVSSELIRKGVPVERIETRGFGDARPAPAMDGKSEEASSRRVDIKTELASY